MNCITHLETPAVAFCRTCGKALCPACERPSQGTIFCTEHAPVAAGGPSPSNIAADPNPYAAYAPPVAPPVSTPPDAGASPGLAFLLGLIPGVGAIYNGQYVKGLVHVVILGVLISIVSSGSADGMEPLFGMMIGAWVFYMAFEAYHTARKRQLGLVVDEFSSIVPMRGRPSSFPAGPVALIGIGVLFLLNTLDIIRFSQLVHYWPVALIALGAYMLYERVTPAQPTSMDSRSVFPGGGHERTQL
jgi:TM2 domain-containing membrane protein YozV